MGPDDYLANGEPVRSQRKCYCCTLQGLIGKKQQEEEADVCYMCVVVVEAGCLTEYNYKSAYWQIIRVINSLFCCLGKIWGLCGKKVLHTERF